MSSDIRHNDLKRVHISPTYFEDLIGGAESYPWELVKAISRYIEVTLIVFGKDRRTEKISETLIVIVEKYPGLDVSYVNNPKYDTTNYIYLI